MSSRDHWLRTTDPMSYSLTLDSDGEDFPLMPVSILYQEGAGASSVQIRPNAIAPSASQRTDGPARQPFDEQDSGEDDVPIHADPPPPRPQERDTGIQVRLALQGVSASRRVVTRGLQTSGYVILEGHATSLVDTTSTEMRSDVRRREPWTLFNNKAVEDKLNDKKRIQYELSKGFAKRINDYVRCLFSTYGIENDVIQNIRILRSLPGCKQQMKHRDIRKQVYVNGDLAVVIAYTQRNLHVWTTPGGCGDEYMEIIHLNKGDTLIFKGDLVHAGAQHDRCTHISNMECYNMDCSSFAVHVYAPKNSDILFGEDTEFVDVHCQPVTEH